MCSLSDPIGFGKVAMPKGSDEPSNSGSASERSLGHGKLFEDALHSLSDGVAVVDREGKFLLFNEAARSILGVGALDVSPDHWSASYGLFLPDKKTPYPSERLPLARALGGETVREIEIYVRNDRNPLGAWISVNGNPLIDDAGQIIGGVAVFRDITSKRKAHEVVRRLSNAVERTADSVFITDENGRIEYVNPAFERTTGYSSEEALGQTPSILKSGHHDPAYYERLWSTILAGNVHTGTVINRKKNGELYHAEQTITPTQDDAGNLTHFVSVVKDVTELKRAKEREVELRLARVVQQRLYPSASPRIAGFDLAGAANPADVTCGDYFDFIPIVDGSLAIAIGDVCGHGFGSALFMAETRAYLRSLARVTSDLGQILRQVNSFLCADIESARFVSLMLLRIFPVSRRFVYSSAGHLPGYVLGASREIKRVLNATDVPLGMFPDREFPAEQETELEEGDLILLLTDGITETTDPRDDYFGVERALEIVRDQRHRSASEIVAALHQATREFAGRNPQLDDNTAVVCKVTAAP